MKPDIKCAKYLLIPHNGKLDVEKSTKRLCTLGAAPPTLSPAEGAYRPPTSPAARERKQASKIKHPRAPRAATATCPAGGSAAADNSHDATSAPHLTDNPHKKPKKRGGGPISKLSAPCHGPVAGGDGVASSSRATQAQDSASALSSNLQKPTAAEMALFLSSSQRVSCSESKQPPRDMLMQRTTLRCFTSSSGRELCGDSQWFPSDVLWQCIMLWQSTTSLI